VNGLTAAEHCALDVGHQLSKIRKIARLLGLELAVVGE
jgi:L-arabinose isomerase